MIIFSRLKNFIFKISSGVLKRVNGKKKIFAIVLSLIVMGFIFVVPRLVLAEEATILERTAAGFFIWIFKLLLYVGGELLLFMTKALIAFCTYNDFANSTAVVNGWVIVRDLVNMFFVVVLLVIAIATILKIESYSYKKMLGRLVLMAVLVNFSKTISLLIIDFAQVVMMTFVNGFQAAGGGNFVTALGLTEILEFRNSAQPADINDFNVAGAYLLGLIMILISTVVVGMMLIILVMRMIVLWILIVLSPLAFFLSIIPQAKKYADQWWSQFTEYVLVGPILAFFLWLSLISVTSLSDADKPRTLTGDSSETQQNVGISRIGGEPNLMSFLIAIGMLVGGLTMTGKMGVIGAGIGVGVLAGAKKMGMGAARTVGNVGKWGGGKAYKYAGRKYNESGLPNPVAFFRAWGQRGEEKNRQAKEVATARSRGYVDELASKDFLPWRKGVRMPYQDMIERREEGKFSKDFEGMQETQKAKLLEELWGKKDYESVRQRRSLMRTMATDGHLDDALETEFFRETLGVDTIDKDAIDKLLVEGCGRDQQGLRAIYDIGEIGKKIGHFEYVGASGIDEKSGEWVDNTVGERADQGASKKRAWAELGKVPSRDQLKIAPHNFGVKKWDKTEKEWKWDMDTRKGKEDSFENKNWDNKLITKEKQEIVRYAQDRATNLVGYDMESGQFNVDETNKAGIIKRWETGRGAVEALEEKAGGKGVNYKRKHFDSFRTFAHAPDGLNLPKTEEEIKEEEEEKRVKEKKERAEAAEKKKAEREEASEKEKAESSGGGAAPAPAAPPAGGGGGAAAPIDTRALASAIANAIKSGLGQEINILAQAVKNTGISKSDFSAMQTTLRKIAQNTEKTAAIKSQAQARQQPGGGKKKP